MEQVVIMVQVYDDNLTVTLLCHTTVTVGERVDYGKQ